MNENDIAIDEYEHQIQATEQTDSCKCNGSHNVGDALWGGNVDPRDLDRLNPFETISKLHDVDVEYVHVD